MQNMVSATVASICLIFTLNGCAATCPAQVFTAMTGEFTSPGYPDSLYPNNQRCRYTINAGAEFVIEITFNDFELQPSSNGRRTDFVKLIDGFERNPSQVVYYDGTMKTPFTFVSKQRRVVIIFSTTRQINKRGFHATYRLIKEPKYCEFPFVKNGWVQCIEAGDEGLFSSCNIMCEFGFQLDRYMTPQCKTDVGNWTQLPNCVLSQEILEICTKDITNEKCIIALNVSAEYCRGEGSISQPDEQPTSLIVERGNELNLSVPVGPVVDPNEIDADGGGDETTKTPETQTTGGQPSENQSEPFPGRRGIHKKCLPFVEKNFQTRKFKINCVSYLTNPSFKHQYQRRNAMLVCFKCRSQFGEQIVEHWETALGDELSEFEEDELPLVGKTQGTSVKCPKFLCQYNQAAMAFAYQCPKLANAVQTQRRLNAAQKQKWMVSCFRCQDSGCGGAVLGAKESSDILKLLNTTHLPPPTTTTTPSPPPTSHLLLCDNLDDLIIEYCSENILECPWSMYHLAEMIVRRDSNIMEDIEYDGQSVPVGPVVDPNEIDEEGGVETTKTPEAQTTEGQPSIPTSVRPTVHTSIPTSVRPTVHTSVRPSRRIHDGIHKKCLPFGDINWQTRKFKINCQSYLSDPSIRWPFERRNAMLACFKCQRQWVKYRELRYWGRKR